MRLRIVACQQVYSGVNPKGHRYTIFEIGAAKPDGTLINEKLRSFEALPIGQDVEVTVTPFDSEEHGRSFTLHRKVSNNATAQVNELKAQVSELAATVNRHEQRMTEMWQRLDELERAGVASGQQQW
jgi:predicted RNase H-like nuclease (RuvC/YqgF family)